jgi:hypothetical protein
MDWLRGEGVTYPFAGTDRPLRACLVASRGGAIAFLDAADPEDERRFSLAHELAHFLRDYWGPRRRAVARLGPGVLEVFDGERPATPAERLHGLLANVPVGFHTHLMTRAGQEQLPAAVAAAERDADRLAYELLAPADLIRAGAGGRRELTRTLRATYGLPAGHAGRYAELLLPSAPAADGWIARLRNPP